MRRRSQIGKVAGAGVPGQAVFLIPHGTWGSWGPEIFSEMEPWAGDCSI